jgi:hypothetical protein
MKSVTKWIFASVVSGALLVLSFEVVIWALNALFAVHQKAHFFVTPLVKP